MSNLPPQPVLVAIEDLLRRYDGPVPVEDVLCAMTGQPADLLRLRAISREIDRLVLGVSRVIAIRGEDLRRSPASSRNPSSAMDELSERLRRYRTLGIRLAGSLTCC
jgi:hypothetical protein